VTAHAAPQQVCGDTCGGGGGGTYAPCTGSPGHPGNLGDHRLMLGPWTGWQGYTCSLVYGWYICWDGNHQAYFQNEVGRGQRVSGGTPAWVPDALNVYDDSYTAGCW
jgi:hypothetical protein